MHLQQGARLRGLSRRGVFRIAHSPWRTVKKHVLSPESLKVESFATFTDPVDTTRTGGGCICDMAPCGCTRAADCTG